MAILEKVAASRVILLIVLVSSVTAYPQYFVQKEEPSLGCQTKVVCYVSASNEDYNYANLSPGMCTHFVLIDLVGLNSEGRLLLLQRSSRALSLFLDLRRRLHRIGDTASFMLAVGGVNQKSGCFSQAIREPNSLYIVVDNIITFLTKYDFDGVDIAWFYPGQYGGRKSDKHNFVLLLQELQLRLQACAKILSITVGIDPKDIAVSYDIPKIDVYVDFVNLLSGDYHDPRKPSHISPLYPSDCKDQLNVQYTVRSYIQAGLNPQKIVILLSTYAYLYTSKIPSVGQPPIIKNVQKLSKLSAQEIIERENFLVSWDDARLVPYATLTRGCKRKWITFNDIESYRRKAEFVLDHQLGGIGAFSIDQDDYSGYANLGPYPFLWAVAEILRPEAQYIDFKIPIQIPIEPEPQPYIDIELPHETLCQSSDDNSNPPCDRRYIDYQQDASVTDCPRRIRSDDNAFDEANVTFSEDNVFDEANVTFSEEPATPWSAVIVTTPVTITTKRRSSRTKAPGPADNFTTRARRRTTTAE